jgi:hypothetical protein
MDKNPVLELPLAGVMRSEIALSLQVIRIHTVGALLAAWGNPKYQRNIEQVFDSPEQARHAMATFACWLGVQTSALANPVEAWWAGDGPPTQAFAPTVES